jgi:hypothetical protein
MSSVTVTHQQVCEIFEKSVRETEVWGNKTFIMKCVLPNGFVIVEYASCVDPANFSTNVGYEICEERIKNKIWELEGYKLQSEVNGK